MNIRAIVSPIVGFTVCLATFFVSSCSSTTEKPTLTFTSQSTVEFHSVLSNAQRIALTKPNGLRGVLVNKSAIPPGYQSITDLYTAPVNAGVPNQQVPGVPPRNNPAVAPNNGPIFGKIPPPQELRETRPQICLDLLASPITFSEYKPQFSADEFFGPEFHRMREEILLYATNDKAMEDFTHILSVEKTCDRFNLRSADGQGSNAVFDRNSTPRLGDKALAYTITNALRARVELNRFSYILCGPVLIRVTATAPANDQEMPNQFNRLVKAAVWRVLGTQ